MSGGTDNHIVLLDLRSINMTGKIADLLVSEVNITANKNTVPFDPESCLLYTSDAAATEYV